MNLGDFVIMFKYTRVYVCVCLYLSHRDFSDNRVDSQRLGVQKIARVFEFYFVFKLADALGAEGDT